MNHESIARKVRGLIERMGHPKANPNERATCERLLDDMVAKYGPEVEDIARGIASEPVDIEGIRYRQHWERQLLIRVSEHLGITPFRVDKTGTHRYSKEILVEAPLSLLKTWRELYIYHRGHVEEVLKWTMIGYVSTALPVDLGDREPDDEDSYAKADPELIAMALAASHAGSRAALSRSSVLTQRSSE